MRPWSPFKKKLRGGCLNNGSWKPTGSGCAFFRGPPNSCLKKGNTLVLSVKRRVWPVFTRKVVVVFFPVIYLPVFGRIKPVFCRQHIEKTEKHVIWLYDPVEQSLLTKEQQAFGAPGGVPFGCPFDTTKGTVSGREGTPQKTRPICWFQLVNSDSPDPPRCRRPSLRTPPCRGRPGRWDNRKAGWEAWVTPPFVAFCVDVRTLTFCQLMKRFSVLSHNKLNFLQGSRKQTSSLTQKLAHAQDLPGTASCAYIEINGQLCMQTSIAPQANCRWQMVLPVWTLHVAFPGPSSSWKVWPIAAGLSGMAPETLMSLWQLVSHLCFCVGKRGQQILSLGPLRCLTVGVFC